MLLIFVSIPAIKPAAVHVKLTFLNLHSPHLHQRPTINKDFHCNLIKLWDTFWLGCQLSKAHRVSFYLSPFQQTKRGKVNPLRSSHLTSGAAESLLFMAHPEGLSTNGIHMISISSQRQEPAFQRISFLLRRTQSRHRATAGERKEEKKQQHIFNNRPAWPDLEMEIQWPYRAPINGDDSCLESNKDPRHELAE